MFESDAHDWCVRWARIHRDNVTAHDHRAGGGKIVIFNWSTHYRYAEADRWVDAYRALAAFEGRRANV